MFKICMGTIIKKTSDMSFNDYQVLENVYYLNVNFHNNSIFQPLDTKIAFLHSH